MEPSQGDTKMRRVPPRRDEDGQDGARIVYHAVRTPFYRKPRLMIPLAVGAVFAIGIGLGTTMGLMLAPSGEPPRVEFSLPQDTTVEVEQPALPEGEPLPVAAYGSDREREAYELSVPTPVEEVQASIEPAASAANEPPVEPAPAISDRRVTRAPPQENSGPDSQESTLTQDILAALQTPDASPTDNWRQFAAPTPELDERPRIAIVLDDLGIDQIRSARAVELPAPLTLAIIPYGYNLPELAQSARRAGHEILVHMPMAPMGLGVDPGPNALHRELGEEEITRRIRWNLTRFDGYVGVNNHMGSRFTADRESMALVISEIRRNGLLYLDSVTTPETQGYRLAAQAGVYHAIRDVFLDNIQEAGAIREQLARAERIAQEQGQAIVIGHPHDETLAVLRDWIATAQARGFQLVPLSALVSLNAERSES